MSRLRPTPRGALVLLGAATAYLVGWAFGTRELAVLALALALAVGLAGAVVWHASRTPCRLQRRLPPRARAGAPLEAVLTIEPAPRLVSAALVDRCAGLGDPSAPLQRGEHALMGVWRIAEPPRGRYQLAPQIVLEDALGLIRARAPLPFPGRLRVEPELVDLGLPRAGALAQRDGAQHAFPSASGDGLAGVRDHEVGESLRRVHWRTTARRGRLTVRELEEHPREQLRVLLDAHASEQRGARSPVFECAVRAAGSLVLHAARRGVAVTFESYGRHELRVAVASGARAALLDALCSVEADGRSPLAAQLARVDGARLCIVTSDVGAAAVERLLALRARGRALAVVAVDAASWTGRAGRLDASVETLARAGIEVVVLRRGDDLARQLSPLVARGGARVA